MSVNYGYSPNIISNSNMDDLNLSSFAVPIIFSMLITGFLWPFKIPPTLVSMLIGSLFGIISAYVPALNQMPNYLMREKCITLLYIPIVVMKIVYSMDIYALLKCLTQILLITTIGTLAFSFSFGFSLLAFLHLHEQVTVLYYFMVGVIFVPRTVPDMTLEFENIKNLQTLMEGETVFGLAFCISCYDIGLGIGDGSLSQWYQIICILLRFFIFSIVIGIPAGYYFAFLFRQLYDDLVSASTTVICSGYLGYFIASIFIYCEPVITTTTIMLFIARERHCLSTEVDGSIQYFLNVCYYKIELLIMFVLANYLMLNIINHFVVTEIFVALAAYILANTLRALVFLLLSPLLSRTGYGLTMLTMLTVCWAGKKGALPVLFLMSLSTVPGAEIFANKMYIFVYVHLILTVAINGVLVSYFLKKFDFIKFTSTRKINITNVFNVLSAKQQRLVMTMKMNRFYSDANWPLIHELTLLKNMYSVKEFGEESMGWRRHTMCPTCLINIAVEPTRREMQEMTSEACTRILKALKVSFSRQYEHGLLNKDELSALLKSVDVAMGTDDCFIKLDDLIRIFQDRQLVERVKACLKKFDTTIGIKLPRQYLKKLCYKSYTGNLYRYSDFGLVLITIIWVLVDLFAIRYEWFIARVTVYTLLLMAELFMFIIKLSAYAAQGYAKAFKIFLKPHGLVAVTFLHPYEFIILIINAMDYCLLIYMYAHNDYSYIWVTIHYFNRVLRLTEIFKWIRLVEVLGSRLVIYCENKIDVRVSYAYTLGKALVIAYEEVIEQITHMVAYDRIQEMMKLHLDLDKMAITQELVLIEKERPWITVTIKTKQAIMSTLLTIRSGIHELKTGGLVDRYEYEILRNSLERSWESAKYYKAIEPISPKHIFYEIPWLVDERNIIDFLYNNVTTKIWNAGDLICEAGAIIEGVFIIVAGIFKTSYIPNDQILYDIKRYGLLPIKDVMNNIRFSDIHEEYILRGNSIGELAVLTGRPYCSTIVSATPSQAFIIPSSLLREAINMSQDPIKGLHARMWKYATSSLVRRILAETPLYNAISFDHMNVILDRAFVPNLDHFKVVVTSDYIEDIVLIDGMIADFNTRDVFKGPCYIPRSVHKIVLPQGSSTNLPVWMKSTLMLIPIKDVDGYDVMQITQNMSITDNQGEDLYLKYRSHRYDSISKKRQLILEYNINKSKSGVLKDEEDVNWEKSTEKIE